MAGKRKIPFDRDGGTLVINRRMLNSPAYRKLSLAAKYLVILLHEQWRLDRPVGFSVREAAIKIGCRTNTACKAFSELRENGLIVCMDESMFNSKTGSKAREWRLTWMPFNHEPPTNDWEKIGAEN